MIAKRKIIITGVSSVLMQKFILLIDFSQYEVIGITRNPESMSPSDVKLIKCDMVDVDQIRDHFSNCYMVIHAAAVTHSFSEKKYWKINLEATRKLIDIAVSNNVKEFVFVSSNTAGERSGAYGLTKLLAEKYIKDHFSSWKIFRPTEIYGGDKKEGIEKIIQDVMTKSVVVCPLNVPTDFFPVHIEDAVKMMHAHTFNHVIQTETVLISGPEGFAFKEFIDLIRDISGRQIKVVSISKFMMFSIKWLASVLPFYIGVLPDQIDRLYSVKECDVSPGNSKRIGDYIKSKLN